MSKYHKTYFFLFLAILVLILPNSYNQPNSIGQNTKKTLQDDFVLRKPSIKLQQTFNPNKTLLPKGNFSITEFWGIEPKFIYNTSILSINSSHWQVECNYTRTVDWDGKSFQNEFSTSVTRDSIKHNYFVDNFYNLFGEKTEIFDYWINTTGFQVGYNYSIGQFNMSILAEESIYMANIGRFNAWKINMTLSQGFDPMTYWYSEDGLFLCLYFYFASDLWWNMTVAEISELPVSYTGPDLDQISPKNNSLVHNGSIIDVQFFSPYGIDLIEYHWDSSENQSSTDLKTVIPSENGSHYLYVIVLDNLGLNRSFLFSYSTDYSIPGIFLTNIKNNSNVRGLSQIFLEVINGNGSLIFNWDGNGNTTITESTPIIIPNDEAKYELNAFIVSFGNIWIKKQFVFTVDNTPPLITINNLENNSIIKGSVNFQVTLSEDSNLTYKLNNNTKISLVTKANESFDISFSDLENGTYHLVINATDEAQNFAFTRIIFSIYTSAFNWNWDLEADSPKTINFIDSSGDLWFIFTLTSSIDQSFNISILPESDIPARSSKIDYTIEFNCEEPEEILFINFALKLSNGGTKFPVYQWVFWDNQSNQWLNISTMYNEVSQSWVATYNGYVSIIALINTGSTTTKRSITPGGGQIPSFEILPALISMIITYIIYRKRKNSPRTIGLC